VALRSLAFGLVLVVTLAFASTVAAKEGVVARVLTPISRDAEPGSRITVVWTLSFVDAGKRRPFGGSAIFVRLYGPDGSRSRRVLGAEIEPGRFRAIVRVPRGGVRRVVFGIMGTACDAEGCRDAPRRFPVVGRVFR
jgi:hypothetical protein